jgi:hypothetical protein
MRHCATCVMVRSGRPAPDARADARFFSVSLNHSSSRLLIRRFNQVKRAAQRVSLLHLFWRIAARADVFAEDTVSFALPHLYYLDYSRFWLDMTRSSAFRQ